MKIIDNIEKNKQVIIKFIQKLIRTPSQNGIDAEKNIAYLICGELKKLGFKPRLIGDGNRPSVLCYCNKSKGKKLLLDAPLDTVPVGDKSKWKYSPLTGKIVGKRIYGRGSADCKAAIACFIYAASAIFQSGERLSGQLILTFDSDEQSGNFTGMRTLLNKGLKADACIIGYPGTDEIIIGARGFLRLEITTEGETAHTGSRSNKGINAINKMAEVIQNLEILEMVYKSDKLFEFGPKLTVSIVEGGETINVVPDKCSIKVDIRLVPSQTQKTVLEDLSKFIKKLKKKDPKLSVKVKPFMYIPPYSISKNEKLVKVLQSNAQRILNKKPGLAACGASGIGNITSNRGIPTISGFGVDFENVHGYNECIYLDSVIPVTQIYALTALNYLK